MLKIDRRGDIAIATLANPPVNALDAEFLSAITDGFDGLRDSDAKGVVLTGEGSCFSAGADLFRVLEEDRDYVMQNVPNLTAAFRSVFEFPRPVVAAINGHAIAGGAIFACACDHRIMSQGSGRIGISELRVGVCFPVYALEIMRFAVPQQHLQELVYLADVYDPDVALAKGLLDEVIAPDSLMERALHVADRLARVPEGTFVAMKKLVRKPALERIARYSDEHDVEAARLWASDEVRASIQQFLDATVGRTRA